MANFETFGLLTKQDLWTFDSVYSEIINAVLERIEEDLGISGMMEENLIRLLDYNVPHGKRIRALVCLAAFKAMAPNASEEEFRLACVAGWINEIVQGAGLIVDDLMDSSDSRRGQPCWYKLPEVGVKAVNDSFLLEQISYLILRIYFYDKPYYSVFREYLRDIALKTIIGQDLDLRTSKSESLNTFTPNRYGAVVKLKTSYYTIYAPIVIALILVKGEEDKELFSVVEKIAIELGHYYQVQDDYLDCFGDPKTTGKLGTDIADGKCTWLVVTALEKCDGHQRQILEENYGRGQDDEGCSVKKVKNIYMELGLEEEYSKYEQFSYASIAQKVVEMPQDLPQDLFIAILTYLYQRKK